MLRFCSKDPKLLVLRWQEYIPIMAMPKS
uniref:Uncharacterized protein n=1 Tax=Anguilla anguilla TaxID=7936 RepID=A0A0E9PJZ7_ANGAN